MYVYSVAVEKEPDEYAYGYFMLLVAQRRRRLLFATLTGGAEALKKPLSF